MLTNLFRIEEKLQRIQLGKNTTNSFEHRLSNSDVKL